jgi:ABC-type nitrate/sulfonate/bicarbonate transport system permease component
VNVGARLASLALLVAAWYAGSQLAGARLLPDPQAVALAIVDEARSGALAFNFTRPRHFHERHYRSHTSYHRQH